MTNEQTDVNDDLRSYMCQFCIETKIECVNFVLKRRWNVSVKRNGMKKFRNSGHPGYGQKWNPKKKCSCIHIRDENFCKLNTEFAEMCESDDKEHPCRKYEVLCHT